MTKLYGIKNCDTVKKARQWLEEHGKAYQFHDFRVDGLSLELLTCFSSQFGWEQMINKRGTTWRSLPESDRAALNQEKALTLMLQNPTLIKRPILDTQRGWIIGFDVEQYTQHF